MRVEYSEDLNVAPEVVYDWLLGLVANYKTWHPDHGKCYWIKGKGFEVGAVLYSEQYLHGKLHKQKARVTYLEPGRCIAFQYLGLHSLLVPRGKFVILPRDGGTRFTEVIEIRIPGLFKLFGSKRLRALERHQREEMTNLKAMLERE